MISSGSADVKVRIFELTTGKLLFSVVGKHKGSVSCLEYNPLDLKIASGGYDKQVRYWDLDIQGQDIFSTPVETTPIEAICFDQEG